MAFNVWVDNVRHSHVIFMIRDTDFREEIPSLQVHIAMCLDKEHTTLRLFESICSLDRSASEPIEGTAFLFRFGT